MGWCSGTDVFDGVMAALLDNKSVKETIRTLILTLESMDWDCQMDSAYWEHSLVQEVFKELHPNWFDDDESS
jgi:hypothetical protein